MATKNNIFERYKDEYYGASKARKSEILDAVTEVTKIHRKAAIRKFRARQLRDPATQEGRGRRVYYTKDVDAALETVWSAAYEPCGELLHPMLVEYVVILKRDKMWKHGDEATGKLLTMKEHTVRRRVSGFAWGHRKNKGLSSTRPSLLKTIIPIFKGPWKDKPPGYGQIDTVAHCGSTLLGDFVYTVNYTDTATYWVIPRAQWNKGQEVTKESLETIKEKLPVPIHGLHPDTGSEFINWNLKHWCDAEKIDFTRSEPGKKNDNMYVEERNGHVVRKYMGYVRFDCPMVVPMMNELYGVLELYLNHFQAVRRTETKERVGAKYKRTYEKIPQTPYRRMLEHDAVSEAVKEILRSEHQKLNPLLLKQEIDRLIAKILTLQKVATA
jgi:hypothetical protein